MESTASAEFDHWIVEPWPDEVKGADLLRDLVKRIRRHNVITEHQSVAIALWVMFAWAHEAAVHSPVLLVTSPEGESGKTQLLSLLSFLAPRGYHEVDPTPASIYQSIDRDCPRSPSMTRIRSLWAPTNCAL